MIFWFTPRYNQLLYVTKHTLTFLLLGLLSIKITMALFKRNLDRNSDVFQEKRLIFFRIITVVSIVTSLTVILITQRNYIMEAETPPIQRCYYYDEFGNYIHGSRLMYNCPEPVVVKTEDSLIMTFEYNYFGSGNGYNGLSGTGMTGYQYRKVDTGGSKIRVEVRYTDDNIIEYYRLQEISNYYADDYTKDESISDFDKAFTLVNQTLVSNYYEVIIETEFGSEDIIQNKKNFRLTGVIDGVSDITDFPFHDFSADEPDYETEYRVEYELAEENTYEFKFYEDVPSRDSYSIESKYEGFVSNIFSGYRIYFENEQTDLGENMYSSQMYNFTINSWDNTSSYVRKYYQSLWDYDFTNLKETELSVLTEKNYISLENSQNEITSSYDVDNYNGFTFFEYNYKTCLLYETDYGYLIEEYGNDGIKDESELSSTIGEIGHVNSGPDDNIIGFDNQTHLFYEDAPMFDYNPIFKYLLLLTE